MDKKFIENINKWNAHETIIDIVCDMLNIDAREDERGQFTLYQDGYEIQYFDYVEYRMPIAINVKDTQCLGFIVFGDGCLELILADDETDPTPWSDFSSEELIRLSEYLISVSENK